MNSLDCAAHPRLHFDNGLIGFQLEYRLLFSDAFSYAYQDLHHITCLHPLTQLGQYKLERCHRVSLPSTPAWGWLCQGASLSHAWLVALPHEIGRTPVLRHPGWQT